MKIYNQNKVKIKYLLLYLKQIITSFAYFEHDALVIGGFKFTYVNVNSVFLELSDDYIT